MSLDVKRFGHDTKKKKSKSSKITLQIVFFLILFIAVALIATIIVANIIKNNLSELTTNNSIDSIWIGSLASYLGGTLGGIFSGAFAGLGVFYTIKYYKESDKEKEKLSIQPFLVITAGANERPPKAYYIGSAAYHENNDEKKVINVTIKNIGNGFASLLTLNNGVTIGGIKYNKVLTVGETDEICLVINVNALKEGIPFSLQYIDAMRNEYIQNYTISSKHAPVDIETEYPISL